MKNHNKSITDELVNKIKYLHKALDQANNIIATLEEENKRLQEILSSLTVLNNKDFMYTPKSIEDSYCAV
jgi:cell fate (sporulation/competence/biofilm development) regulator YlbF (YheA/YmcA/DUF963 family)